MLFLENEVQINKNNYRTMVFMSKKVSLPKMSSILKKMKISPKSDIGPFSTKLFNYMNLLKLVKVTPNLHWATFA